jgi:HK97 family phage major capsid protein
MSVEIKELLEKQGQAFEAFKAALADEAKSKTAESEAKTARINDDLTRLAKEIKTANDRAEAAEAAAARPSRGDGKSITPAMAEYKAGLFNYIRKGEEDGLEKKALSAGVNPDGGYTVHSELDTMIDRVARTNVNMRNLATVRTITGRSFKKLVTTSGAGYGGWGNEHTAPTETTTPGLVELEFTPGTLWAEPRATQELLEDSDQNIEAWLADEVGIIFEATENQAFIDGNGVNRPRGFLDYSIVANASYAWGSIGYVPSGGSGAFRTASTSVSPVDDFIALRHALKPVYRQNAVWLMNDATVATVRKFKDGSGNLQWKPGASVAEGFTETFLGHPISYDDQMPDVASNSYSVAFGDFKRGYLIVDRLGTQVIRDSLTSKPYVKFYTRRRVGGGVQNFEAIKVMKMATS